MRTLTESNIEEIAAEIRKRLDNKLFAIASMERADSGRPRLELKTNCQMEPDWTDRSKESVRALKHDDGRRYIAFSAGGYYWPLDAQPEGSNDETGRYPRFSFDWNSVIVEFRSPSGDLHRHCFTVQLYRTQSGFDAY